MKILGNILWLLLGGFAIAMEYFTASLILMLTIVGIPFGIQTIKLGILALWPFGQEIVTASNAPGFLTTIMNILWFIIGGFWIFLTHVFFGILLYITILGIPWGNQHFKLAKLALTPFGRNIV